MTPDRRAIRTAALAGAALAFVIIAVAARFDVDRATFGDGVLHRYVAEHLTASPEEVTADLEGHGTALRYSRIVLPLLIWIGSAGRPEAMPYVQPLLMIIAAAAIAAAARVLVPSLGRASAVAPFVAVGLIAALAGGFAEPVAVAFALWGVVAAREGRWLATAGLLALAMLTRENAVFVMIGLTVWQLRRRGVRVSMTVASSALPVATWHLVVASRLGFLPLNDPWVHTQSDTVETPFVGLWRSMTSLPEDSMAILLIHCFMAAVAFFMWRRSELWTVAAACGIQLLFAGPFAWRFIGDATRLMAFLEVFVVLALLSGRASPSGFHALPEHRREELVDGHVVVGQDP